MPETYAQLPVDEQLWPEHTREDIDPAIQAERMRALRKMQNAIPAARLQRDRELQRLANSGSLDRRDMARAIGVHKSRVDQIVRELTLLDQRRKAKDLIARMRLHMPEELVQEAIKQYGIEDTLAGGEEMGEVASASTKTSQTASPPSPAASA